MCNTCGLPVGGMRRNRVQNVSFPQRVFCDFSLAWEKHSFIPRLHNFYTHFFPSLNVLFQSVILNFYTVCTRLIITKTI